MENVRGSFPVPRPVPVLDPLHKGLFVPIPKDSQGIHEYRILTKKIILFYQNYDTNITLFMVESWELAKVIDQNSLQSYIKKKILTIGRENNGHHSSLTKIPLYILFKLREMTKTIRIAFNIYS
jgi:hypothetical protein